jgi:hypothetical protein
VDSFVERLEFSCNAEELDEKGKFKTSVGGITLDGAAARDSSVSRSGKYSVRMSEVSPYAFTYQFTGLKQGDMVEIHAWQKGTGAQMVVSGAGKKCGEFFYNYPEIKYTSQDGWGSMEHVFTMNKACLSSDSAQCKFFIWCPEKTVSHVDDIKFIIKKFDGYYFPD